MDRGSETQLQVTENLNWIGQCLKVKIIFSYCIWALQIRMLHLLLYPSLSLLGRAAAVVLGAVTGGHLEAVVLSQQAAVQGFDLHVWRCQIYRVHAARGHEQGLMGPRRPDPTVDQGPVTKVTNQWMADWCTPRVIHQCTMCMRVFSWQSWKRCLKKKHHWGISQSNIVQ